MNIGNTTIKEFTDLLAWKEAYKLGLMIYEITKSFPKEEQYSLTSQIRRAVVSITCNIAEGFGRQTYQEKIQFYYIAQGSTTETKNLLLFTKDLKFVTEIKFNEIDEQIKLSHKLLQGLITKSKQIKSNRNS